MVAIQVQSLRHSINTDCIMRILSHQKPTDRERT